MRKRKKWDANWKRLTLETKVERLKEELMRCYKDSMDSAVSARASASAALYVANLSR